MNLTSTISLQLASPLFLKLKSFSREFRFLIKQNKLHTLHLTEIVLPAHRTVFTLLKSPHVFKTARIQFEQRLSKLYLILTNFQNNTQWGYTCAILQNIIKQLPIATQLRIILKLVYFV